MGDRVLLGLLDGTFVLVDRDGQEVARGQHPLRARRGRELGEHPIKDIAASGNRFAATHACYLVFGSIEGDALRFEAETGRVDDWFTKLHVSGDDVYAYGAQKRFTVFGFDGKPRNANGESPLERKLQVAWEGLAKVQGRYAEMGGKDPEVDDAIWEVLRKAVFGEEDAFPGVDYGSFAKSGGRGIALRSLDVAVKKVFVLLREAKRSEPLVATAFMNRTTVAGLTSGGILCSAEESPVRERYGDGFVPLRRTSDGKVILESYLHEGKRGAWIVDADEFSPEDVEVGSAIFTDASGEVLFIRYQDRLERVDVATGEREIVHRGRIERCHLNERDQFVISTNERPRVPWAAAPNVILFDPISHKRELIPDAVHDDHGIVQYRGPTLIRDLEGRGVLNFEYAVDVRGLDRETKTVAFVDRDDFLAMGDGQVRIARAGHSAVLATLGNVDDVRLGRNVAFARLADYVVKVFDLEDGRTRTFKDFFFAGPFACSGDVLYAQVVESRNLAPRLAVLSKDGSTLGPELPKPARLGKPEVVGGLAGGAAVFVRHVSDDFLVISDGGLTNIWILDRRTLATIDMISHPRRWFHGISVRGDVVSLLNDDDTIHRYRVRS